MKSLQTKIASLICASFCMIPSQSALGASGNDPDWPCIQGRVDEISIGQMWPFPLEEKASLDEDAQSLVSILSLRRVTHEEAENYVKDYAADHPENNATDYGTIYSELLARINLERSRIIAGISRYAHGQQDRAQNIDAKRKGMQEEEAKDEPDFDKLDALEAEIDWDERIYKEREQSLTYVCETPVILEKRAYELAQILIPYAQ